MGGFAGGDSKYVNELSNGLTSSWHRSVLAPSRPPEILRELGLNRVRLMSNNPEKMRALERMGFEVVERVSLQIPPPAAAIDYLRTKKEKMGHLLELV